MEHQIRRFREIIDLMSNDYSIAQIRTFTGMSYAVFSNLHKTPLSQIEKLRKTTIKAMNDFILAYDRGKFNKEKKHDFSNAGSELKFNHKPSGHVPDTDDNIPDPARRVRNDDLTDLVIKVFDAVPNGVKFSLTIDKRVILILLMVSFAVPGISQRIVDREKPRPAVYLATQPADFGFGVRGDYNVTNLVGFYGSVSYGRWRYYKLSGLDDHVKISFGPMIPIKDYLNSQFDITVGLNYHWTSGEITDFDHFKEDGVFYQPWSFEIGLRAQLPRFSLAFRTDILRWEPCVDIGIPIGGESIYRKRNRACNMNLQ